jgi:hypothetical protein
MMELVMKKLLSLLFIACLSASGVAFGMDGEQHSMIKENRDKVEHFWQHYPKSFDIRDTKKLCFFEELAEFIDNCYLRNKNCFDELSTSKLKKLAYDAWKLVDPYTCYHCYGSEVFEQDRKRYMDRAISCCSLFETVAAQFPLCLDVWIAILELADLED